MQPYLDFRVIALFNTIHLSCLPATAALFGARAPFPRMPPLKFYFHLRHNRNKNKPLTSVGNCACCTLRASLPVSPPNCTIPLRLPLPWSCSGKPVAPSHNLQNKKKAMRLERILRGKYLPTPHVAEHRDIETNVQWYGGFMQELSPPQTPQLSTWSFEPNFKSQPTT